MKKTNDDWVEGMKFWDNGHDDLDKSVKIAQANSYGSKFYIITIVKWKANVANL